MKLKCQMMLGHCARALSAISNGTMRYNQYGISHLMAAALILYQVLKEQFFF